MKPAAFDYHRPLDVPSTLTLLEAHGTDGKILAGGQSLVAAMNFRLARPSVLIDVNRVRELDSLAVEGTFLRIGALTRHAAFHRHVVGGPLGLLLTRVAGHIAHYPIRQRGTFAGSLAHADPASEWCLTATVLDAEITMRSLRGSHRLPASDFFRGTFTTALDEDELITEIWLPVLDASWRGGFSEFSRRAGDFALAMALAVLKVEGGVIRGAKLGIGGVADRAIRLSGIEAALIGQQASEATFQAAAAQAREAVEPSADIHASSEYRRDLIAAMVSRALAEAAA
ncbi:xanthine dehydrogenase family protein subunit M [Methylobacterium organophilum]|uniref:FAD binding domain-containing protein n=1 Tax=Methylobacterium organophilum TaxID=410 RepID=UPI001F13E1DA|nr:xanthine dehydrogenase family protein subunit M [Methylobacterium organophilum]UMY18631.1 xanthine dehydrogenase family protein subunit M [Methylobacterium organophilum]